MIESFSDANEELKRVDHMIFVSLKYTRTMDVIVNIIRRMINCTDSLISLYLKYAEENNMLDEKIPKNKALKAELLKNTFSQDKKIIEMTDFYMWLRKILRAKHDKVKEFKRHVALVTQIKHNNQIEEIQIGIDQLEELYITKLKQYMKMASELIKNGSKKEEKK